MELLIVIIVVVYLAKNAKGRAVIDNLGDTAVELSAASKSAATALHRQCDELMNNEEAAAATAKAKAKLNKAKSVDNYDDAE